MIKSKIAIYYPPTNSAPAAANLKDQPATQDNCVVCVSIFRRETKVTQVTQKTLHKYSFLKSRRHPCV